MAAGRGGAALLDHEGCRVSRAEGRARRADQVRRALSCITIRSPCDLVSWMAWPAAGAWRHHGNKCGKQIGSDMETVVVFILATLIYWFGLLR
ncbi:Uncharacterised protein [Nocardia otitidiscaviarum]|uniref:Uncharacterized protein n=1 Tax=Nocardia otitidiscaviarum TaxID=1823 RepID=A0A378YFL4_9NOCA|nr:Uncharacterised protein [Nocardia otitidiscaviarum]